MEDLKWIDWAVQQPWCLRITVWPKTSQGYGVDVQARPRPGSATFRAETLEKCIAEARAVFGGPDVSQTA